MRFVKQGFEVRLLSNDSLCVYVFHGVICSFDRVFVMLVLAPAIAGISLLDSGLTLHGRDVLLTARLRFQPSLHTEQVHRVRPPEVFFNSPVRALR